MMKPVRKTAMKLAFIKRARAMVVTAIQAPAESEGHVRPDARACRHYL